MTRCDPRSVSVSVSEPARRNPLSEQPNMRPRLVLFGDSITELSFKSGGWGAALTDHFARQADVVLRGLDGYNTRWALKVLPRAMEGAADADPAAITVFLGANDASLPDHVRAHQNVPLQEYQTNLRAICAYFKERWPSAAIILITPPPIYEPARIRVIYGVDDPSRQAEKTNEAAGSYAQACIAVAKELGHPVIDIWTKMQKFPDWQTSALSDGLHFTPTGNKILFDEVVQTLASIGFSKESLPYDLPLYPEIDPKDPMKAFGA